MPTTLRFSDPTRTAAELDGVLPAGGALVLFEGVAEPDAVAAADALAGRRGFRLHHIHARTLVADAFDAMQGNVREAFDEARTEAVVLLTGAEALLDARPTRGEDEPEVPPPDERLRRYLLDRATAFQGVVAFATAGPAPALDAVRPQAVTVTA